MAQSEFDAELDSIRQQGIVDAEAKIAASHEFPGLLYHYAPLAAVHSIVAETRGIWATEGHFMNDTSELRHAAGLIADYLDSFSAGNEWLIDPVAFTVRNDAKERRHLMFVASFSAAFDSLSQWRAYANDGAGVALGFDLSELRADDAPPIAEGLSRPVVCPCVYDRTLQREVIETSIRPIVDFALAHRAAKIENNEALRRAAALHTLVAANELGGLLKNSGFSEEREWRILVVSDRPGPVPKAVKFRNTRFGPAPYVEVSLRRSGVLPLHHVVVGPRVDPAAIRALRMMFDREELDVRITQSEVTYRA
jgi:Protein of unknown function (DUF2971)